MYVCANCGVEFDGKVCPNCCTMRPSAAVIVGSGSILKKPEAPGLAPGQQAARFAQELEHSRQLDAKRQARQEHNLRMRQRAAELAEAEERQRLRREQAEQRKAVPQPEPVKPADKSAEKYVRQLQKAVSWTRKAPRARSQDYKNEESITVTDALRSLKISSAQPRDGERTVNIRPNQPPKKANAAKASSAGSQQSDGGENIPPVPSAAKSSGNAQRSSWSKTPNAERIDAAWRLFAKDRAADAQSSTEASPEEEER